MKDSLFEALMSFFEKTLTQIKLAKLEDAASLETALLEDESESELMHEFDPCHLVIRSAKKESFRIFTSDEQFKLTKASYQFIMRLMQLDMVSSEMMEQIIHQLMHSDSPFITIDETQWVVRNLLEEHFNADECAWIENMITKQKIYYH